MHDIFECVNGKRGNLKERKGERRKDVPPFGSQFPVPSSQFPVRSSQLSVDRCEKPRTFNQQRLPLFVYFREVRGFYHSPDSPRLPITDPRSPPASRDPPFWLSTPSPSFIHHPPFILLLRFQVCRPGRCSAAVTAAFRFHPFPIPLIPLAGPAVATHRPFPPATASMRFNQRFPRQRTIP